MKPHMPLPCSTCCWFHTKHLKRKRMKKVQHTHMNPTLTTLQSLFPKASERSVLLNFYMFTSASHLLTLSLWHLRFFSSSYLHISHLHIFTSYFWPSHLQDFVSSHLRTLASSRLLFVTSSRTCLSFSHLDIFTSSHHQT